jgi:hypothetical protein
MSKSFKLMVKGVGDTLYVSNACRFATAEEVERYGQNLLSRWFGADDCKVEPSDDEVNYVADEYGNVEMLEKI